MSNSIIGTLEERRCKALADFYLGQIAPSKDVTKGLNLKKPQHLYEFLLLDSRVGQELETSRLAEGIACLQQYIGGIYWGLEPGHTKEFTRDEVDNWHHFNCNYSTWAGNQMLKDYPENYIDPTLRLNKSDSFRGLEINLGQASLNDKAVQMALYEHLKNFEEVCNLDLRAGYINSVYNAGAGKGENFQNADYYLIGRQKVQPFGLYWRKAYIELKPESTLLPPAAWDEWKAINIPASKVLLGIRPVFSAGRLMLVLVEGQELEEQTMEFGEATITVKGGWSYDIKVTYLAVNGTWSTPMSISKGKMDYKPGQLTRLVVTNYLTEVDREEQLQVCFAVMEPKSKRASQHFYAATNALFSPVEPDTYTLNELIEKQFSDPDRLQYNFQKNMIAPSSPIISRQASGAQFLDIESLDIKGLRWIRLNSLFAKELVAKAAISIDEVLSLTTQRTLEPAPVNTPSRSKASETFTAPAPIDFNSAHGTFYWELFFHLPFLIAHRLREERNYLESQRWFHYLFNPHVRTLRDGAADPTERYWFCRPLWEKGSISYETKGLNDPDAIAFSNRIHYRKAVFMGYVRCIIEHADSLYRQLTRDSLAAAKQQYMRALGLMGVEPTAKAMSHWKPQSAADILNTAPKNLSALELFASSLGVDVDNLPARVTGTPDFEILGLDVFRPFTNEQLLNTWTYIEECLSNLRHSRTIDGKPVVLPLYESPTNPRNLLQAQAGGSSGAMRNAGGWKTIPHYRFRPLLAMAQNAAQTLIGFGREVKMLMEARDRAQFEELQQGHVIKLGEHAITIQVETIKQLEASQEGLKQSQKMIEERAQHYKDLRESKLLALEVAGDYQSVAGKLAIALIAGPHVAAGVADLAPNIFGFANGGTQYGAPLNAAGTVLQSVSSLAFSASEIAHRSAFYLRREQDWKFAENQAKSELLVTQAQQKAHQHTLNAARASLAQTQRANEQAQEIFSFYKTRSTNVELYRWLLGQMATNYFQTYDAVVWFCLSAQSALQFELGDNNINVIRTDGWMDNRFGQTAGETLLLDLLRLERLYIERNEYRLELTKTLSLRQLFERGEFTSAKNWETVIGDLKKGPLDFSISQRMLDRDYPGLYRRTIASVSISLPAVIGPYQDVRVRITQIGSTTLHKADTASLDYMYSNGDQQPPNDVVVNSRSHQQVGISHGIDDAGIFQMGFGDERLLPFEETGAVSNWRLEFSQSTPDDQHKLIETLTDIIVHLRYRAKDGGAAYTDAVLEKLGS